MSLDFDNEYRKLGYRLIVGTDEAGRGPLAGPVVAAAVVLPVDFNNEEINDSKQLTDKKRRELLKIILDNCLGYGVAFVDAPTIDEINIYQASRQAMTEAIKQIKVNFECVLTDAMKIFEISQNYPLYPIIKGDAKSLSIASASIIAKVTRDDFMIELDKLYPEYGFAKHKGYGTKQHLDAIKKYGPIKNIHRFTFRGVK